MTSIRNAAVLLMGVPLLVFFPQQSSVAHVLRAEFAMDVRNVSLSEDRAEGQSVSAAVAQDHAGSSKATLRLNAGQRWATDAPLVAGMNRIRAAVTDASQADALDAASAALLARNVRDQVNFLIVNCKLEPEADAVLHVFIAQLLSAASEVEADPASPRGLPEMEKTLRAYPQYFSHPGWSADAVSMK